MATDKRARKREARTARQEAMRRQRNLRIGAIVTVMVVVVGFALAAGTSGNGGNGGGRDEEPPPQDEAACGADAPEEADPQQYDSPPKMQLRKGVDYRATVVTSCGDLEIDLLEKQAPVTVNNFVFLAREGYFDGLIWHRVEFNLVIQTGDPNGRNGTPPDGPGYEIKDELWAKSNQYKWGAVGMANSGPNTGGSQWFIVTHEPRDKPAGFQALYSVFGVVDQASYPTLEEIRAVEVPQGGTGDPAEDVKPITPVYIETIEISES